MPQLADIADQLRRLESDLEACVEELHQIASQAADVTMERWAGIVLQMTGSPPQGLPATGRGANGAEFRAVLIAVQQRFDQRLREVEEQIGDSEPTADRAWHLRHRRLDDLVTVEVKRYLEAATPTDVKSVFGQAAARQLGTVEATPEAPVVLHRCRSCGAPRPQDAQYGNCTYCNQPFFTGRNNGE